jgi:RNA polymerase sigma-70 factor (family 1)
MVRSMSIHEEKALLIKVSQGEVGAFRTLFDAYRVGLYAAALKITKSDYAAEEIVQETFASLWESRSSLLDVENPPAYIFTIAYNKTFRHLKKVSTDSELLRSLMARMREGHEETREWLDARESGELINQAVAELPAQRKLIYQLSREQGLSHEAIAGQLNISPFTVKKQISLALRNIRDNLAKTAPLLALFFLHELP